MGRKVLVVEFEVDEPQMKELERLEVEDNDMFVDKACDLIIYDDHRTIDKIEIKEYH